MVIQVKLEPNAFWICALGVAAGVVLFPIIWNKKRVACLSKFHVEANQEIDNKQSK